MSPTGELDRQLRLLASLEPKQQFARDLNLLGAATVLRVRAELDHRRARSRLKTRERQRARCYSLAEHRIRRVLSDTTAPAGPERLGMVICPGEVALCWR
jgi:hypothetical protein